MKRPEPLLILALALAPYGVLPTAAAQTVLPDETWAERAPAEVGMDDAKLDAFATRVGGDGLLVEEGESLPAPTPAPDTTGKETPGSDPSFRFLAIGDCPYSGEQEVRFRRLLEQSERERFSFLVHVGDIKAGATPCSDEALRNIRDIFRAHPTPVVFTPGDNEWTDCHATDTDPRDPLGRLGKLRELFFEDRSVLRLEELGAKNQSDDPRKGSRFATYIENYRFTRAGVLFIVVHVVGSLNNRRPDEPASMKEFTERTAANTEFLKASFAEAIAKDVPGVALIIHANPDFEKGQRDGFAEFQSVLRHFLSRYRRPVVCVHGDSHYYRIDKPFRDESGKTFLHFTRMEVFGSPKVAGVSVTVDPGDPEVFTCRPYYVDGEWSR